MSTTEKMTIHKALSELKMLDKRINTAIAEGTYCVANKHSNEKINGVPIDEFVKSMQGQYDKAVDLINRRKAIKRAVVLSNAVTKVTVAGIEYTVAEAIEMKNHGVDFDSELMMTMKKHYKNAQSKIEKENGIGLDERADRYVTDIYGQKDGKTNNADIEKLKQNFLTANQYELVDPLNVLDKIDDLEKRINDFLSEVDSALSVSNALTVIEVEY